MTELQVKPTIWSQVFTELGNDFAHVCLDMRKLTPRDQDVEEFQELKNRMEKIVVRCTNTLFNMKQFDEADAESAKKRIEGTQEEVVGRRRCGVKEHRRQIRALQENTEFYRMQTDLLHSKLEMANKDRNYYHDEMLKARSERVGREWRLRVQGIGIALVVVGCGILLRGYLYGN